MTRKRRLAIKPICAFTDKAVHYKRKSSAPFFLNLWVPTQYITPIEGNQKTGGYTTKEG